MSPNINSRTHELYGSTTAFLGGITFTAFVLLIGSKEKFLYTEWLIPSTAIVSFFLILATFGRVNLATTENNNAKLLNTVGGFTIIGFFGIMILIPLFILSFSLVGSIVVGIIEIIGCAFYFRVPAIPSNTPSTTKDSPK